MLSIAINGFLFILVLLSAFIFDNPLLLFLPSFLFLTYLLFYKYKFSFIGVFIFFTISLFHVGSILAGALSWNYGVSNTALSYYVAFQCAGLHLFLLWYEGLSFAYAGSPRQFRNVTIVIKRQNILRYSTLVLLVLCLGLLVVNFPNLVSLTRADMKNSAGLGNLTYLYFLIASIFTFQGLTFRAEKLFWKFIYLIFILVAMMLSFLVFKTRTALLLPLLSFLSCYLFVSPQFTINLNSMNTVQRERIPIFILTLFSVIILSFAVMMRFIRGMLETGDITINLYSIVEKTFRGGDLGFGEISSKVIQYVLDNNAYLDGNTYIKVFYLFLPRSLFTEKPTSTQRIIGEWLMPSVENMTIPPGFFTDFFVNFYVIGFFVIPVIAFIFFIVDAYFRKSAAYTLYVSMSCVFMFHFVRGALVNPIVGFGICLFGYLVFRHFYRIVYLESDLT